VSISKDNPSCGQALVFLFHAFELSVMVLASIIIPAFYEKLLTHNRHNENKKTKQGNAKW
jgi:hypothetical protein